jgi:hypothetical protein
VVLRPKSLEIRKKVDFNELEKTKPKAKCHEMEPNPSKDRATCMREIILRFEMNL